MEDLGKEGVLFDSFSESNSKEGSLRAGNNIKPSPVLGARLQACLEDVAAARQSTAAEAVSDAMKSEETPRHLSSRGASSSHAPDPEEAPKGRTSLDELPRQNSSGLQSLSSYELRGSHASSAFSHMMRPDTTSSQMHELDPSMLPLHWRQAVDDADVPISAFFDYPCPVGPPPSARWGHAAAAVGDRLFVFGGESPAGTQSNAFVFNIVQNTWRAVPVPSPRSEDALPAMSGHAACAVRDKIYMFGGRQNRKYLQRTYVFDTGRGAWKCPKKSPTDPPGLFGHTLTSVGQHGIYLFGGQGKKPSNAVYSLDPDTITWAHVDTKGERPDCRQGHSAVWDFADSLIVFGGLSATSVFNDVHVLSLSTGYWSRPQCIGQPPPKRYGHSAVMVASNLMLVFGGCSAQGAFYNDLYLLNTATFRWHRMGGVGAQPSARYGHACSAAAGRVIIHGGSNGAHAFEDLFTVSTAFGRDFNSIVAGLGQLRSGSGIWRGSSSSSRSSEPAAATSDDGGSSTEAARTQLANLLHRRTANDLQAYAARRADISEGLLQKERARAGELEATVAQLRLMLEEAGTAGEAARADLRAERQNSRRAAQAAAAAAEAAAAETQTLQTQRQELQGRCERLESRVQALQQRCSDAEASTVSLELQVGHLQQRLRVSTAQLAEQNEERGRLREQLADTISRLTAEHQKSITLQGVESQLQTERRRNAELAAELAKRTHVASHAEQSQQAGASNDPDSVGTDVVHQLACLQGSATALGRCSLPQLHSLEGTLSSAMRAVRNAMNEKISAREAAVAERERAAEEATLCSLCMERPKTVALGCGHQTCSDCADEHDSCPFCRKPVQHRIVLYQT
ncbi:Acyl-CoA-binding domain-containing protein 4 [Coccomyxa sp. Obi]|nr:Acyl-CoA-binding domain-containing protein 4 [Coccomyxa sp. Obi]